MYSTKFQLNKPFFVEPRTGFTRSYVEFFRDINHFPAPTWKYDDYRLVVQFCQLVLGNNKFRFRDNQLVFDEISSTTEFIQAENFLPNFAESQSQIQLATSGTTGTPKPIIHSIKSLTRGIRVSQGHGEDVWGLAYPIGHLSGLSVFLQAIMNGNTIVQLFGSPTDIIHSAIQAHSITHLSCTPTFLNLLGNGNFTHPHLRRLTTGGERSENRCNSTIKQIFPNAKYRNIYALTEVGNLLISDGEIFSVPENLCKFIRIQDETLAIHQSLLVDNQRKNRNTSTQNDWYITGDLVEVIETSPLKFKFRSRLDDIINVGGYKVVPQTIEKLLLELDGVQQALVYGKQNSVTGQIVVCDIVATPGKDLKTDLIRQQLAKHLPPHSVPRFYNLVSSLELTANGKLCRHKKQLS
jgi:acyl-coenzyme A synthetase/AMP-(fatty) acid ligase